MAAISILAGGVFGMISALTALIFFGFSALAALGVWSLAGLGFATFMLAFAMATRSAAPRRMSSKAA